MPNPDLALYPSELMVFLPDVLILAQFVDSEGKMIDRYTVGMCKRQYVRVGKLVRMAQKAGLMEGRDACR